MKDLKKGKERKPVLVKEGGQVVVGGAIKKVKTSKGDENESTSK